MAVYVDQRWGGYRGIARYAHEISSRLTTPNASWTTRWGPTNPVDVVAPQRLRLDSQDILYSPGFSAGLARCRQLITLHDLIHLGDHDPRARLHRSYYDLVARPALRKVGHVLTVSEASRTAISNWLDDESVSIHVTGEGTSVAFHPQGEAATFERPYFLYVGNLRAHKNPQTFFAAMARLPDHRAVVVTSDVEEARAQVDRFGLSDRATLLSGIDDGRLASLYRGASALVFPSLVEGFGLPPLEAIRSGCPVVRYAGCAAVTEICGEGGPGAVGSPSDVEAWREAMVSATTPTPDQVARAARHDWATAARTVDDLLMELADA